MILFFVIIYGKTLNIERHSRERFHGKAKAKATQTLRVALYARAYVLILASSRLSEDAQTI